MNRSAYLARAADPAAHRFYYAQFVTDYTKMLVRATITLPVLLASRERAFNDIPLTRWDALVVRLPRSVWVALREHGDSFSLAGATSILKEAAQQIVDEHRGGAPATLEPSKLDWKDEARRLRGEREKLRDAAERIAFDNQWSLTNGLPVGLLILALESEERDALLDAHRSKTIATEIHR